MEKSKVFISGVSSGIGRSLTKKLILDGHIVFGVARRVELLKSLQDELNDAVAFSYMSADCSQESDWKEIINQLKKKNFIPDIVIFNAAILENDLEEGLNYDSTKRMIETNFLGIMYGISLFLELIKKPTQFLTISSSSAFKGSGVEGVGYAASKAALSIAFESLYQKYKKSHLVFKTIFFGPVISGMSPFTKAPPLSLKEEEAVDAIIASLNSDKSLHYYPFIFFLFFKLIKLLPQNLYFKILSLHERLRNKFRSDD